MLKFGTLALDPLSNLQSNSSRATKNHPEKWGRSTVWDMNLEERPFQFLLYCTHTSGSPQWHSPELRPDSLFTLLHTKIPLLGHFRLRTLLPTLSHETDTASSGSWKMQKGEGRGWLSKKRGRIGEGWFLHSRHFSFRKKHSVQQSTRRQIFCLLAFRARSLVGSLVCTNFHDVLGYRYAFTRRSICTVSIDCNTRYVH